jgi:Osteopetrosis-associated transmembrane protein 1 precursor.
MTDTTVKLLDLSELTDACILTNQNTSVNSSQIVCDKCKEDYLNLNSYYNCHKSAVCMDIVDMVCS